MALLCMARFVTVRNFYYFRNRLITGTEFALYQAVGSYLKTFPATVTTPLKLRYPDLPFDGKPAEPPAVPRGWKLSSILPLHSGALSGGGISEDIFREMMQGMGMNVDAGNPSSSLDKKDKKDKKKGKR